MHGTVIMNTVDLVSNGKENILVLYSHFASTLTFFVTSKRHKKEEDIRVKKTDLWKVQETFCKPNDK